MRWPLGVVDVVYAARASVVERALAARADGFAHIDPLVDTDPKYARQAVLWAASLLVHGEQEAESLVVHTIGETDPRLTDLLDSWGVEQVQVEPFDSRHPYSNKLVQFATPSLQQAQTEEILHQGGACVIHVEWGRDTTRHSEAAELVLRNPKRCQIDRLIAPVHVSRHVRQQRS